MISCVHNINRTNLTLQIKLHNANNKKEFGHYRRTSKLTWYDAGP